MKVYNLQSTVGFSYSSTRGHHFFVLNLLPLGERVPIVTDPVDVVTVVV